MANEKSKAEQYRDERKARIAKAAKKNAHNMEKAKTAKNVVNKVISIILVAVIALGIVGWSLSYWGVLQRLMPIGAVGSEQKVTVAEFEYYYMRAYNEVTYQEQYYQYYNQGSTGYDTTLPPDKQTSTTKDDDGNEIKWTEKLREDAIKFAQMYKAYYNEAVKAGIKLDAADNAAIEKQIDDVKEKAKTAGGQDQNGNNIELSANAYLRKIYGNSMNVRFLRKLLKVQTLAYKFYSSHEEEIAAKYTDEEIKKLYNDGKGKYDFVTFCGYTFSTTKLTAEENEDDKALEARQSKADAEVKKNAEAFFAAVKDEATFIAQAKNANKDNADYDASAVKVTQLKNTLSSADNSSYTGATEAFGEEAANWLFNASTKVGQKKLTVNKDEQNGTTSYTIVLLLEKPHQVKAVNVRHILFNTIDTQTNEPLSDEEKAKAKKNAEDTLNQWKKDGTETGFAALANEKSEDTGSSTKGGLYKHIIPGQMVKPFNDWCFDSSRKPGDAAIVETSYGYHVMYFVEQDEKDFYDSFIREEKANTDNQDFAEKLLDGDDYVAGFGPRRRAYAEKNVIKKITNLVEISNANQSANSTTN